MSVWFRWNGRRLGLDDVRPEVSGYGVRPIHVAPVDENVCHANFKLPPGLPPGWHEVRLRIGQSRPGSPQRIAVDVPTAAPEIQVQANGNAGAQPGSNGDLPRDNQSPCGTPGLSEEVEANSVNVQKVVREIHARLEQEEAVESLSGRESEELAALRSAFGRLFHARNAVGQMPPGPNTIRAKFGRYLVRAVQRSLFWYTPQIVRFQNEATNALDCACNLIAWQVERIAALEKDHQRFRRELPKLSGELPKMSGELMKLNEELLKLRVQLPLVRTTPAATEGIRDHELEEEDASQLPNDFQFALQDCFRGSESETIEKLRPYLSEIEAYKESLPQAPWLDIGCGRGEWLQSAGNRGYSVVGIDSNPVAVAHCCAKGLHAEETDALGYLRSLKSESLAVVTTFHTVEHWPIGYLLALMREAVRALKPGGLMIIETPNPANLKMGSSNFWKDPTHRKPIPPGLLEFIYRYFGLNVVKQLDLNPSPQNERLPYDEISVVHRLNESLCGPQDYGLIGRR